MNDLRIAVLYTRKAKSAKERGIEFNLSFTSFKNLMNAKKCFYTGVSLTEPRSGMHSLSTDRTIDRVDNTLGYVKGNVVACCNAANQFKAVMENPNNIMTVTSTKRMLKKIDKFNVS